jgi:IS1 family transposase
LHYSYNGRLPEVKQQVVDMALNGSGIRDTARVLKISPSTVIKTLKKAPDLKAVNVARLCEIEASQTIVNLCQWEDVEAEADEMWSFVTNKSQQRWLWHAIDHLSGTVLAYVLAAHEDEAFVKLKGLLEPFGITQFYTDGWGAYERLLNPAEHTVGKRNTQKIERKHLTFRTRIKRLARKTICFSKSIVMHDVVIGLFINRFEFGCAV